MNIIIDTSGQSDLLNKDRLVESDDDAEFEACDLNIKNVTVDEPKSIKKTKINKHDDFDLDEFECEMGWSKAKNAKKGLDNSLADIITEITPIEKILEKSAIKPGFENLKKVPGYDVKDKKLKNARRRERSKSKGKNWFNLPATEMTEEIKHDLEIIQMRSALDPKRFYKKNDMKALPKYFQVGKVLDSPLEFYTGRMTNKERKKTIVDELMADAEFSKFNKRKYKEIIDEKKKLQYKAHRHAKRLKKKKK